MSTTARTTRTSGKATKTENNSIPVKPPKSEVKTEPVKTLPTPDQLRFAQIIGSKSDDATLKQKIKQAMDATRKTEDEVSTALFDCDNDLNRAITYLLEDGDQRQSEWLTKSKKKKNRTASVSKADGVLNNHVSSGEGDEDWDTCTAPPEAVSGGGGGGGGGGGSSMGGRGRGGGGGQDSRERPRQRGGGGGPPRMRGRGSSDNRSWRGRENKENERNLEDGYSGGGGGGGGHRRDRPGRMSNGGGGGGSSSRGGRGDRGGPRTFQGRGASKSNQNFSCPIETWSNPGAEQGADKVGFPSPEDWDNEEYTGSLADSKVFTPSTGPEPAKPEDDSLDANSSATPTPGLGDSLAQEQSSTLEQQPVTQLSSSPVGVGVNTLTPEQSQYLSQLTQSLNYNNGLNSTSVGSVNSTQSQYLNDITQPSEYKSAMINSSSSQSYSSIPPKPAVTQASYPTTYPTTTSVTSTYGSKVMYNSIPSQELNSVPSQTIPAKSKSQRPRVPPPSKIPSSAVEMPPGDSVNSNLVFMDAFGALEFGSGETTLDTLNETSAAPAAPPASVVPTTPTPTTSPMDSYTVTSTNSSQQQTSIASAPTQSQKSSSGGGESLMAAAASEAAAVVSSGGGSYSSGGGGGSTAVRSVAATTPSIAELSSAAKPTDVSSLTYSATASESPSIYQSTATVYQKTSAPVYQTPASTYNSASYSTSSQVTSSGASAYNNSGGYASGGSGGGYTATTTQSAYPSSSNYSSSVTQQTPGSGAGTSYPSFTSYPSNYQTTAYASHTVPYGASYPFQNSYSSSQPTASNHKIGSNLSSNVSKDSQYDSVPASSAMTAPASITPVSNTSVTPSLGLSANQQAGSAANKVAASMSKVQNMPPGVQPLVSTQYMIGQAAGTLPYYQQPPAAALFSYDDLQMLQQRIPQHVPAGYYDMGYQPQTTLATGREGLGSVAYTMPDARFTRADNNTSPVPSTLSQQSGAQGGGAPHQPMMGPGPYSSAFYLYGTAAQLFPPGNYQYAAAPPPPPQLYTPVAAATQAAQASQGHAGQANSAQYANKGPAGTYSSVGYGSGYDTNSGGGGGGGAGADYTTVKVGGGGGGSYSGQSSQSKSGSGVATPANTANQVVPAADLSSNIYNKSHATLSKVNSYDKQAFHSGTPPPFNHLTANQNSAMPHLYIPSVMGAPHQQHHSAVLHQPMHQDGGAGSGPRSQTSSQQNKSGAKQSYNQSAWYQN
ncbi:protein lingerer isoform X2 [Nilaparvata lugens]|uniref:protein lingerer isoform X2 n=1 Tax=Nilaparvata lugens TaxID=108931 RepID=UPI00193D9C55|nr:protein lingerer isoform X2 [Nilaparvata lugens]